MSRLPGSDEFKHVAPVRTARFIYHATFVDDGGVWRDLIFREDALEGARAYALERGAEAGMHLKFISRIRKDKGEISLLTHRPFQPVPDFTAPFLTRRPLPPID